MKTFINNCIKRKYIFPIIIKKGFEKYFVTDETDLSILIKYCNKLLKYFEENPNLYLSINQYCEIANVLISFGVGKEKPTEDFIFPEKSFALDQKSNQLTGYENAIRENRIKRIKYEPDIYSLTEILELRQRFLISEEDFNSMKIKAEKYQEKLVGILGRGKASDAELIELAELARCETSKIINYEKIREIFRYDEYENKVSDLFIKREEFAKEMFNRCSEKKIKGEASEDEIQFLEDAIIYLMRVHRKFFFRFYNQVHT